jgi:glutamyl/glutaminyl-tRNA synthetase
VRMENGLASALDLRHGALAQRPSEQCGDLAVRDRDGHWTYQFAVTVDDLDQGITLVIRGDDLLESTGRQVALAKLLGRQEPPLFLHHALLFTAAGEKLSKSAGDTGVRSLRAAGARPDEVIGRAAAAVGLAEPGTRVSATEVPALFCG